MALSVLDANLNPQTVETLPSVGRKAANLSLPLALANEDKTAIDLINTNLGVLDGRVDGLETAVAATNTLLTTQNSYLDGVETAIASTNTKLDTLATHVDTLETLIAATNTALGLANTSLDNIEASTSSAAPTIVTAEASSWQYIAASATDTAAGNAADLLDSLLVVPTSKSPGAVSFEDGAGTNYTLFAGGADSLTTLIPFPIDMRNIVAGTAWEITTGTGLAVFAFYRQRT